MISRIVVIYGGNRGYDQIEKKMLHGPNKVFYDICFHCILKKNLIASNMENTVLSMNLPADSIHSSFLHSHVHCLGQYLDHHAERI